jgi:phytoene dehydrogenase-like protein
MVGAATWPGAGNNATSGYLAAREILRARRAGGDVSSRK